MARSGTNKSDMVWIWTRSIQIQNVIQGNSLDNADAPYVRLPSGSPVTGGAYFAMDFK